MFQPLIFRGVRHVDADSSVVCLGKRVAPHQPHWSGNTMVTYGGFAEWCWRFSCPTDLDEEGWCGHQLQDISCRIYCIYFNIYIYVYIYIYLYIYINDFCGLLKGWKILDRQALKLETSVFSAGQAFCGFDGGSKCPQANGGCFMFKPELLGWLGWRQMETNGCVLTDKRGESHSQFPQLFVDVDVGDQPAIRFASFVVFLFNNMFLLQWSSFFNGKCSCSMCYSFLLISFIRFLPFYHATFCQYPWLSADAALQKQKTNQNSHDMTWLVNQPRHNVHNPPPPRIRVN